MSSDPVRQAPVEFEFDANKAVAVIAYLASRPEGDVTDLDRYKVGKLVFLADKYHLVRYGSPILGDEYRALEWGPIPQGALDIFKSLLDETAWSPDSEATEALRNSVEIDRTFQYPRVRAEAPTNLECLSRSEIMALDHIIALHGRKGFNELKALTHATVAYLKAWKERPKGSLMAQVRYEDFFEQDADAIAGAFEEMIENDALRKAFPSR